MAESDERAAVLAANEAFYRAFTSGDFDAMDRIWAHDAPVACLHPGWAPLHGRDLVMESWAAILGHDGSTDLRFGDARALLYDRVALVICFETIERNRLAATNVFVREGGAWKIVHHQSGPTEPAPEPASGPASRRLH